MRKPPAALTITTALTFTGCVYNTLQTTDEQVESSWSEVINRSQRRADLMPKPPSVRLDSTPAEPAGTASGGAK